jgi:hypothetical protein
MPLSFRLHSAGREYAQGEKRNMDHVAHNSVVIDPLLAHSLTHSHLRPSMPLSFVFIQNEVLKRREMKKNWITLRVVPNILKVPGIGPAEAAKLAVNDVHGAVETAYDFLAKWLSCYKGKNANKVDANNKFFHFLKAKDVGVDDEHRRSIVHAAYKKFAHTFFPGPPPDEFGYLDYNF